MLLAVDIGNTNTTIGLFDGEHLVADFRLRSVRERTADEYAALLSSLLSARGLAGAMIHGVAMAYVVPPVGDTLRALAEKYYQVEPLIITPDSDIGMEIRYQPPGAVGADRLVNAVAARARYGAPCIIVDYGTATTLDAVGPDGAYLGGAILPGIGISLDALFSHAALLSRVELKTPLSAIGGTTADALRSGILYGFAAQTDGMVRRFLAELGENTPVIATGGIAPQIAPHAETITAVEELLTLNGLRLLYESANG